MKKWQGFLSLILVVGLIAGLGYYATTIVKGTNEANEDSLKLGLDLAGGVSVTYQAEGDFTAEDLEDTRYKLQQRVDSDLGENSTTEGSVYIVGDDRITVEVPGVKDANALLEELGSPGNLYFIRQKNDAGTENYSYDSTTGAYVLNYTIEELEASGDIVLTGSEVNSASAQYENDQTTGAQEPVVSISLNDAGTEAFATATTEAYASGESIGIYYDDAFVSVPTVQAAITDGNCVINGMSSYEEAENLASYIRIGGLNVTLTELESRVVGATLGSDALATSFKAGMIGLVIVMILMIALYLLPGLSAALALGIYTTIMLAILYLYDITLTLPGIAGIILSIGMAVDANVIIFARIREEIATGKEVKSAIDSGFKKALSAILDGNITTLIVAAVLGVLGSGTVKGFAITLAIGVVLSMFTALAITRWILNSFYAIGLRNEKFYGKAKPVKVLDFMKKKVVFFVLSSAIILVGLGSMFVHSISGYGLNYSLEFLGGTSTTVTFDKEYSIAEIDSDIVPLVSEVTGDNDIQTQKVDDGNGVIFKTRTLDLEEREALNTMFEENFGVTEDSISSENISSTIGGEMRRQSLIAVLVAALLILLYIWFRFKDLRFGGSAVIALIHDVLIVLSLYAVARISVGSPFIACMLTVIGYSVNDTIVIFDRIRENLFNAPKKDKESLARIANESISQTLSRSVTTSLTTAIMVLMLLILGTSSIREFALPLLVGVITGTYSSICLATELWFLMRANSKSAKIDESKKKKTKKKAEKATKENEGLIV
ncbi:MAG: protein translocase subunit SecD [Lachnospiraceae bacterium]|nr:protein translocase subunit SecD [Lachnospiraceae bacterium]